MCAGDGTPLSLRGDSNANAGGFRTREGCEWTSATSHKKKQKLYFVTSTWKIMDVTGKREGSKLYGVCRKIMTGELNSCEGDVTKLQPSPVALLQIYF